MENNASNYQSPLELTLPLPDDKFTVVPAKKPKNFAIIGGGIAGMDAAIILAKRGHSVTIYEKSGHLGGFLISAGKLEFKEKVRNLLAWYENEIKKYPSIKVELYTKIKDAKDLLKDPENPVSKVLVATGATTHMPRVKGLARAIPALDYLNGKSPVYGTNVIVIGGGVTGCEIAMDLINKEKNPTIIEIGQDLLPLNKKELKMDKYSVFLRDYLKQNAELYLNTKLHSVTYDGILASDEEGKFKLKCDHVIYALGYDPDPVSAPHFIKKLVLTCLPFLTKIKFIGNAKEVGNIQATLESSRKYSTKI